MFKSSRRKIVAAIMSVLVLLWVGTLGVIYIASYWEMEKQNDQLLRAHAEMYTLPQGMAQLQPPAPPMPGGNHGGRPGFDPESPRFRLSTFYCVAIARDGQLLDVENEPPSARSDGELEQLARSILQEERDTGKRDDLTFLRTDKGGYTLVTFLDNTVLNESAMTLLDYTLLFGGAALVVFFFLSLFLAKKIVRPLEESYQKQKQFISDAGHELKTPVTVVSANAELLGREIGDNQWLANIQYENARMGMLVGQLLDLARTEAVAVQKEHVDLSRLVAGEALPFESVAFEKGLSLVCRIDSGISLEGNSTQLKQLTSILLDNAIRHSREAGQVRLTLTKDHSTAKLSVENPGEAIPPDRQEQIFERFYRMDTARNGEDKHYGLGLSIAKAIVTAHHGQIRVLCHEGLVEFSVTLKVKNL